MAKSASDTKVEDVLSSVRRLVSEELPRNERPALPEGPGALVLTNDQRVESKPPVRIAGRTLEERIAELEVAVADTANDDEFEPDGSEDQTLHRPDRIVYTRPPKSDESEAMRRNTLRLSQIALIDTGPANDDVYDGDDDVQVEFRHDTPLGRRAEEAPMAEDVKETLTAAEVHVFSSPDDEVARIEARLNGDPLPEPEPMSPLEKLSQIVPDQIQETGKDEDAFEDKAEDAFFADIEQDAESKDTLFSSEPEFDVETQDLDEDTVANSDEDFEADLEEAVAASVQEHAAPLPQSQEVSIESADTDEEGAAETAIAEEAIGTAVVDILDEEDLRPIVASLIREELQGELGERITRNVRKLVRREILRALAARDVE